MRKLAKKLKFEGVKRRSNVCPWICVLKSTCCFRLKVSSVEENWSDIADCTSTWRLKSPQIIKGEARDETSSSKFSKSLRKSEKITQGGLYREIKL